MLDVYFLYGYSDNTTAVHTTQGTEMIGHDTEMRDWIATTAEARSHFVTKGVQVRVKSRSDETKRRLDDLEERRQFEMLAGKDPY